MKNKDVENYLSEISSGEYDSYKAGAKLLWEVLHKIDEVNISLIDFDLIYKAWYLRMYKEDFLDFIPRADAD